MKIPTNWPTREMVDAAWVEIYSKEHESNVNSATKVTLALVKALEAAPEIEPVYFVRECRFTPWFEVSEENERYYKKRGWESRILYARPAREEA